MESIDELLRQAEVAHGHLCAGQVLGVRMAMLGCHRLGITEPRGEDLRNLSTILGMSVAFLLGMDEPGGKRAAQRRLLRECRLSSEYLSPRIVQNQCTRKRIH